MAAEPAASSGCPTRTTTSTIRPAALNSRRRPLERYALAQFEEVLPDAPSTVHPDRSSSRVSSPKGSGMRRSTALPKPQGERTPRGGGLAALRETNRSKCELPLDDAEIEALAAHVFSQEDRPEFLHASSEHHLTDLGNAAARRRARRAPRRHRSAWRLVWDDRRWARDETGEVMRRAKATALALYREALAISSTPSSGTMLRPRAPEPERWTARGDDDPRLQRA